MQLVGTQLHHVMNYVYSLRLKYVEITQIHDRYYNKNMSYHDT